MPVPFDGEEFTFTNPDGSTIAVRGWGSQFAAVFETLDGYTIVKDPESGYYQYAKVSAGGDLVPSGVPVSDEAEPATFGVSPHLRPQPDITGARARAFRAEVGPRPRWETRRRERRHDSPSSPSTAADGEDETQPSSAVSGKQVGLCLLIQFPDVSGAVTQQQVTDFCNKVGYSGFNNNGSVRDYFHDISEGRLTYTNVVTAYQTTAKKRSYYTDPTQTWLVRARELIIDALDELKADGFDFSQLTADTKGFVRALNVFYAGPCVNNWCEGLWPGSSSLDSPYTASSGRKLYDFQITNMGAELTLKTFCHENGHMVCDFPDLYDYGKFGIESNGIGHYCLMCAGGASKNPVQPCGYLKREAGWVSAERAVAPGMSYEVQSSKNDFLVHAKNTTEYFVIENRQRSGRDAALPDEGLAIWHVDENGSNDYEYRTPAQHYECSLEQADGKYDLELAKNQGDGADLFGAPGPTAFGKATTPDSRWWDGTPSGLDIASVTAPATAMTVATASAWQHNKTVLRAHAKNGPGQAWALLSGSPWLQVRTVAADGAQNVFAILCVGVAKGRKVDVLVDDGMIIQAVLR